MLSLAVMQTMLDDLEKRTVSVKITVTSVKDQDSIISSGIWFGSK